MKFNAIIVLIYGLMVLLGGLVGYLLADSLPSLIMGSICGAFLFASGIGLYRTSILAFFTALTVSGLLTLFFTFRYFQTYKMVPSGMMAAFSIIVFLLLLSTKGQRPTRV